MSRYEYAPDDVCGLEYRPGELSMRTLNYCRLKAGHKGDIHSTRWDASDQGGFEWTSPIVPELEWPDRPGKPGGTRDPHATYLRD